MRFRIFGNSARHWGVPVANAGRRTFTRFALVFVTLQLVPGPASFLPQDRAEAALETLAPETNRPEVEIPNTPSIPADAKPPGEREPLIGALAAASIVVAAAAGIYVYRVIRKGL